MRVCYISRCYNDAPGGAGIKAKSDVEDILASIGAINLGLKRAYSKNKVKGFLLNLAGILKYCFAVKRGDVIVLQYPVKKYFTLLCKVASIKGASTVSIIHDLGTFRRIKLSAQEEIKRLSASSHLVTLNSAMREWLIDNGCKVEISVQGVWDYLSANNGNEKSLKETCREEIGKSDLKRKVVYAGSLAEKKNPFLYEMMKNVREYELHLFGNLSNRTLEGENVVCHGFVDSNELINNPTGDFALVWDGDSVDTCSGRFGEYLRYNTPHKVSFYIRMGLPVIIWREAAMAKFITNNKIGFCIDSLEQLNTVIPGFSTEEYAVMKENVARVSGEIAAGEYLKRVITTVCGILHK